MNIRTLYLFTIACAFPTTHGIAEQMTTEEKDKVESVLSFDIPRGLDLSLSKEDTKGSIGATYAVPDNLFGLALTGKLKDNTGEFVGLDGIDANTKVTGTWSHFVAGLGSVSEYPFTFDKIAPALANQALGHCQQLNHYLESINFTPIDNCENEQALVSILDRLVFSPDEAKNVARLAFDIEDKSKVYNDRFGNAHYNFAAYSKKMTELRKVLTTDTTNRPLITSLGVFSASVSYFQSKFEWLNTDTLTELDKRSTRKTKDGFDVTLSYAQIIANPFIKWEVGTTYQKGFSNATSNTEREICFGYGSVLGAMTECVKGFLLPPTETETISPFFKVTHQLGAKKLIKAIGLNLKYTFEDKLNQLGENEGLDRWTLEVPVHLVDVIDKKLSAGFKLSWVSKVNEKEDPIKFVLFVSAPLTIFSG